MIRDSQLQVFRYPADGLQPGGQAAHLLASHHSDDQGQDPHQHDDTLDKVCFQCGDVTAQNHHRRGS